MWPSSAFEKPGGWMDGAHTMKASKHFSSIC
jgi:hypothetical protein